MKDDQNKDDPASGGVEKASSNETHTKTVLDLEAQKGTPEASSRTMSEGDNPEGPFAALSEQGSLCNPPNDVDDSSVEGSISFRSVSNGSSKVMDTKKSGVSITNTTATPPPVNTKSSTAQQSQPNNENLHYPKDSYSFMALHGPFERSAFFWFGFAVFLLQIGFFAAIIASVFHPVWSTIGQDDNPGGKPLEAMAKIVPSNASPIVHATQILVSISYIFITDASMDDFATAFDIFPMKTNANKGEIRKLRVSCGLRFVQGLLALFTAIILIVSSNDAIEIVLNFTALNFVSNFDNVVFGLALGGKYGAAFRKEASDINNGRKVLPECMRSRKVRHRYLASVVISSILLIPCLVGVIWAQSNDDIWVTKVMRVEFEGMGLDQFTGCYIMNKQSNYTTYRRKVYTLNTTADEEEGASFAYCAKKNRWLLLQPPDEGGNVCEAGKKELAYSSKTDSFDVFKEFEEQWFSASGTAVSLNFINFTNSTDCSMLANGECNSALNKYEYGYDGGDCCSLTCNNSNCASFVDIEEVFGVQKNMTGIHFPNCKDPQMKYITIHLSNFTSSWDDSNLDVLYPKRNPDNDQYFDSSSKVMEPSRLTLECDDRYALVIDVTDLMSNQTTTVRVKDGANCTIEVKTNVKNGNCNDHCYVSEDPFWIFDYAIYEGNTTGNADMIVEHNSVKQGKSSFLRIPECFSDKISDNLDIANLYQDKLVMNTIEWMAMDTSGYSDCRDESFLERFELILLIYNLDQGDESLAKFVQPRPTCLWDKVECKDAELYKLDFTSSNVSGYLPSTVGLLTRAKEINLGSNQISVIPTEIGSLQRLTTLSLWNNSIAVIPTEIGNLKELAELSLWNNIISVIPTESGNLKELAELSLWNNNISVIPTEIGNLNKLTNLGLSRNQISVIPTEIGNLKELTGLSLWNNSISVIPTESGNLKELAELSLWNNNISVIPTEIGNLNKLTNLGLSRNQISVIPTEIGNLKELTRLSLWNNSISVIPTEFGNLNKLTDLGLSRNQISVIPTEFGNLNKLTDLTLSRNQISVIPTEIGNLKELTELSLWSNSISVIPTEIGNLNELTNLGLSRNQISVIPTEIGNLNKLTNLVLSRNQISVIPTEFGNLKELAELSLWNNSISVIPTEFGNLKELTSLTLGNNSISVIPTEFGNLKELAELSLWNNSISVIPTEIGNVTELTLLTLGNNSISVIPTEIGNLEGLALLELCSNEISAIPTEIGNLDGLVSLNLAGNEISVIPTEIGNLEGLTSLCFLDNKISVIPSEIGMLTALEFLHLDSNPLSGELPNEIGLLTTLKCLSVDRNSDLTISDSLRATIHGFPNFDKECSLEIINPTAMPTSGDHMGTYFPSAMIPSSVPSP